MHQVFHGIMLQSNSKGKFLGVGSKNPSRYKDKEDFEKILSNNQRVDKGKNTIVNTEVAPLMLPQMLREPLEQTWNDSQTLDDSSQSPPLSDLSESQVVQIDKRSSTLPVWDVHIIPSDSIDSNIEGLFDITGESDIPSDENHKNIELPSQNGKTFIEEKRWTPDIDEIIKSLGVGKSPPRSDFLTPVDTVSKSQADQQENAPSLPIDNHPDSMLFPDSVDAHKSESQTLPQDNFADSLTAMQNSHHFYDFTKGSGEESMEREMIKETKDVKIDDSDISSVSQNARETMFFSLETEFGEATARSSNQLSREQIKSILEQIASKSYGNVKGNHSELEIHLEPDFLGKITIRITSDGEKMIAKILTDNFIVKELLTTQTTDLKNTLENKGIDLSNIEVTLQNSSQFMNDFSSAKHSAQHRSAALPTNRNRQRQQNEFINATYDHHVSHDSTVNFFA